MGVASKGMALIEAPLPNEKMAIKKHFMKAALVLLLALITGIGAVAVSAGEDPGIQLVLVLDLARAPAGDQAQNSLPEAAALLVHLLKEPDYLGLAATGADEGVIAPPSRLIPEHRAQILGKLAGLAPGPQETPLPKVLLQALGAIKPEGPAARVLLILSDQQKSLDPQSKAALLEEDKQIADLARKTGVAIYAADMGSEIPPDELKFITAATGGRLWVGQTPRDLYAAVVNFFQRLARPQEAPVTGSDFHLDEWVRKAVVVAGQSVPGQGVVLASPTGARISRRTPIKNIQWLAGQGYDLITMLQPRPGTWRLIGARGADCRVFLTTDLTLTSAGTPTAIGADEALLATAALKHDPGATPDSVLADVEWRADLETAPDRRLTVPLQVPERAANPALPAGTRVARFPPLHQEGNATLTVLALGKTFQRAVTRPISITQPWYRVSQPPLASGKVPVTLFQPDPDRRPENLAGCLTLKSSQGGLAGVLITPRPGSEIILQEPPGCEGGCLAGLHLSGTAPGGRPLDMASGPIPASFQNTPAKAAKLAPGSAAEEKIQVSPARKKKRRWLWLAIVGTGIAVLVLAGLLLWQDRPGTASPGGDEEAGGAGNNILRLQAQLEALSKEKAKMQAALEEKNHEAANILAEKTDLQAELDRISSKTKGNVQSIEELEKKLEQAEQEAKGVQEEYMALYARNQQEKEAIKKN